jgi:hypothetical protein
MTTSPMQAFDVKPTEPLLSLKNVKDPIWGVDEQTDLLFDPFTTDVVTLVSDLDTAITAHSSDKGIGLSCPFGFAMERQPRQEVTPDVR